jgi:hypothetical protein
MNHIERLKEIIEREYSTTAKHVETVPVHEIFEGETIWDGEVEVFEVPEYSEGDRVFAWAFEDDNCEQQITIAQIPPATTPENAVKAYIVSQYGKH